MSGFGVGLALWALTALLIIAALIGDETKGA